MPVVEFVRKKDFHIGLVMPVLDGETQEDHDRLEKGLIESIYLVKPSFIYPRLMMEIRQPVRGRVANAVVRLCLHGIRSLQLRTVFPDQPDLANDESTSHIIYEYGEGRIVEQETIMCRDAIEGDDLMVHSLIALFEIFDVRTIEWVEYTGRTAVLAIAVDNTITDRAVDM